MADNSKCMILDNGIALLTDEVKSVETVCIGVWVNIGSRDESALQAGLSHFLEHMAFKGTPTRNSQEISKLIEGVGGYMNAYTSRDMTAYYIRILKDDVELAMELLADILINSTFDTAELNKERGVILQEYNQGKDSPDDMIDDIFLERAFQKQPLGRPIIGTKKNIKSFKSADLKSYIHSRYSPDTVAISVSGNVNSKKLYKLANKLFSKWVYKNHYTQEAATYTGGHKQVIKDHLEQVQYSVGFEGPSFSNIEKIYAAKILKIILGGGMSSRLFQTLREERGLVYGLYVPYFPFKETGLFGVQASTEAGKIEELTDVLHEEIKTIQTDFVTDEELNRVKKQIESALAMELESLAARATRQAYQHLFEGEFISVAQVMKMIHKYTKHDILEIAREIFMSKPTVAMLGEEASINTKDILKRFSN